MRTKRGIFWARCYQRLVGQVPSASQPPGHKTEVLQGTGNPCGSLWRQVWATGQRRGCSISQTRVPKRRSGQWKWGGLFGTAEVLVTVGHPGGYISNTWLEIWIWCLDKRWRPQYKYGTIGMWLKWRVVVSIHRRTEEGKGKESWGWKWWHHLSVIKDAGPAQKVEKGK